MWDTETGHFVMIHGESKEERGTATVCVCVSQPTHRKVIEGEAHPTGFIGQRFAPS